MIFYKYMASNISLVFKTSTTFFFDRKAILTIPLTTSNPRTTTSSGPMSVYGFSRHSGARIDWVAGHFHWQRNAKASMTCVI